MLSVTTVPFGLLQQKRKAVNSILGFLLMCAICLTSYSKTSTIFTDASEILVLVPTIFRSPIYLHASQLTNPSSSSGAALPP